MFVNITCISIFLHRMRITGPPVRLQPRRRKYENIAAHIGKPAIAAM
jgi:hypothetical protein